MSTNPFGKSVSRCPQSIRFKKPESAIGQEKKIMKPAEDVKLISAEAPIVFIRACKCRWTPLLEYAYAGPPQHDPQTGTHGVLMGNPVKDRSMYAQQSHAYMAQQMWQQPGPKQSPSDH
ncbi:hypothetical protein ACFE04_028654 [Oxalis oulophora]